MDYVARPAAGEAGTVRAHFRRDTRETVRRRDPTPPAGKTAVTVLNHYGDEVMKVYSV